MLTGCVLQKFDTRLRRTTTTLLLPEQYPAPPLGQQPARLPRPRSGEQQEGYCNSNWSRQQHQPEKTTLAANDDNIFCFCYSDYQHDTTHHSFTTSATAHPYYSISYPNTIIIASDDECDNHQRS
jgi:hypothetical protein